MSKTVINKNQTGSGIWTSDTLTSGNNIEISNAVDSTNYYLFGNATVSSQGILSGCNSYSGLRLPFYFSPASYDTWEWQWKVTYSTSNTTQRICGTGNNTSVAQMVIGIDSHKLITWMSSTGSSWDVASGVTGTTTLSDDTVYYVRAKFTGTQYVISLKTEGGEYVDEITVDSTTKLFNSNSGFMIGTAEYSHGFAGTIDLNGCQLKANGTIIWKGVPDSQDSNEYHINASGVYSRTNLLAGTNVTIGQVQKPVITSNVERLYHFDSNAKEAIQDTPITFTSYFKTSYVGGKFGQGINVKSTSTSSPSINIGSFHSTTTTDFTYDVWLKPTSSDSTSAALWVRYNNNMGAEAIEFNNPSNSGLIKLSTYLNGVGGSSETQIEWPVSITWGDWFHVAYVNDATHSKVYLFVNGKKAYEVTRTTSYSLAPSLRAYGNSTNSGTSYDEFRVTLAAVWTSDFTPFTEPYSASDSETQYAINGPIAGDNIDITSGVISVPGGYTSTNLLAGKNIQIQNKNVSEYIVSNFSTSNYADIGGSKFSGKSNPWNIILKVKTPSSTDANTGNIFLGSTRTTSATYYSVGISAQMTLSGTKWGVGFGLSSNGTSWDIAWVSEPSYPFNSESWYYLKFSYNGSNLYKLQISDDGETYTDYSSYESSTALYYSSSYNIALGKTGNDNRVFNGSIDIRGCSITANGSNTFNGATAVRPTDFGLHGAVTVQKTNGSVSLINNMIDPLPSQTGNSGKFLTTDGTSTSWSGNIVQSTTISTIVQCTQAEYDALVQAGTVDANTLYIIQSAS